MDTGQLKDAYRLWWEFLKENADYEKFCKETRRLKGKKNSPLARSKIIDQTKDARAGIRIEEELESDNWSAPDTKILSELNKKSAADWFNYKLFGDIHKTKFDTWWKRGDLKLFEESFSLRFSDPVSDVAGDLKANLKPILKIAHGEYTDAAGWQGYRGTLEIKPSPPILSDGGLEIIQKALDIYFEKQLLYLKINTVQFSLKEITAGIKALLTAKKSDPEIKLLESMNRLKERLITKDRGRKDLEFLQTALMAYRKRREGKTYAVINGEIQSEMGYASPNKTPSTHRKAVKKVERIIANTGRGFFPGEYQNPS